MTGCSPADVAGEGASVCTVRRLARTCQVQAEVAAPIDAVWRVVSDVTRTGEWSHECHSVHWLGGATSAVPGARFRGGNKAFWWRWSRTNEVTDVEPGRTIAWRTLRTWRFVDSTVCVRLPALAS